MNRLRPTIDLSYGDQEVLQRVLAEPRRIADALAPDDARELIAKVEAGGMVIFAGSDWASTLPNIPPISCWADNARSRSRALSLLACTNSSPKRERGATSGVLGSTGGVIVCVVMDDLEKVPSQRGTSGLR